MRTLLYHCPAGLSGDMNLGAMIDLGADPDRIEAELVKLGLDGWKLVVERDARGGITGTRCTVVIEDDSHHHHHHHNDPSHHHHHSHTHGRTFAAIRELILQSTLSERVRRESLAIFTALAEAEAAVHGVSVEEVHFHEVGALDSIIDIVAAAVCWELLGIDRVVCTALELGGGTVHCAHGIMPVPAPATARLVVGLPVSLGATDKEATTPTGAAILAGIGADFVPRVSGLVLATGTGVGQRHDPKLANVAHVTLLEAVDTNGASTDSVVELTANLDDMTPEGAAWLVEQLFAAGAVDAWQCPATFKKGRLGVVVSALAPDSRCAAVEAAFFRHSTTLGIRKMLRERTILPRNSFRVPTALGEVEVKESRRPDGTLLRKVEFEDRKRLAVENGLSLPEVEQLVEAALRDQT